MLTAALIAGLLGVTARPAAAGHAPASVFGADVREYHLNQLVVDPMPGSDQSYAKAAGLDWIRAGISWPDAQPAKPDAGVTSQIPGCTGSACFWNQDYMDRQKTLVKKLTDRGYTPIVVVYGAPDWVNGAHKPCWVPDEHFDTFATFLNAAVKEFKASGIPLEHWQIWNEPEASIENFGGNMDQGIGCFGVKGNAKTYGGDRYARFMQKYYKAVKDADATAKVISGGAELGCHDCPQAKFWESALGYDADGDGNPDGTKFFDIFDYHAYAGWAPGSLQDWSFIPDFNPHSSGRGYIFDKLKYARELLAKYGGAGKPVILGETGLACNVNSAGQRPCGDAGTDAGFTAAQASTVIRIYTRAMMAGLLGAEWFSFGDGLYFESELIDLQDDKVVRARPGFSSMRFLSSQIGGARVLKDETCNLNPGQELCQPGASPVRPKDKPYRGYTSEAYTFCKGTTAIGVVWSNDFTKPVTRWPLDPGATVYDMYGNQKAGATTFELGPDPNIVTQPNRPECGYQPPSATPQAQAATAPPATAAPALAPAAPAAPAAIVKAGKSKKKTGPPFAVTTKKPKADAAADADETDRTDAVAAASSGDGSGGGSSGSSTPGAEGRGDLPFTGAGPAIPAALAALVLLLLGVTMLVMGRRRVGKR